MAKNGYDPEKDVLIAELGDIGDTDLFAEVRSYDEGEEKISILRRVGKEKDKTRQVCRLSMNDAQQLGEFLFGLPWADEVLY